MSNTLLQLLLKPANRNLLDVATKLPQLGVGSRVTRKAWAAYGDSYWEITAVKPKTEDGTEGQVFGVLTWRGVQEPKPRMINGHTKKVWRWMPTEQQLAHYQQLAKEFQRLRDVQRQATQNAAAASAEGSS